MQKRFDPGVTIIEYDRLTRARQMKFPREEGYKSNGAYERNAVAENGKTIKIKIHVEKSKKPDKNKGTKSYLPGQLMPYSKYPIDVVSRAMELRQLTGKKVLEAAEEICKEYDTKNPDILHDLVDLCYAQFSAFKKVYEAAWKKYIIWQRLSRREYGLEKFIGLCVRNDYRNVFEISGRYYAGNGGRFLFGTASQFLSKSG